ncbi:MAG: DNA-processing protein DprA, partial [Pseudomonadota bacterium]
MTPSALAAWLSLASRADVTAATLAPRLAEHGDIEGVAAALGGPRDHTSGGCEAVLRWLEQPGTAVVTSTEAAYPPALYDIPDAPILLYVLGDTDLLAMPALAIVGSRKPTSGGRATAHDFAREFAGNGLCIVSGLALGIDAAAHRGALAGDGATVAVLGTGIDRVYPAANRELALAIATRGAIISEFPLGTEPRRSRFPRRNRLISGLALGTLVVEAAEHSGSL